VQAFVSRQPLKQARPGMSYALLRCRGGPGPSGLSIDSRSIAPMSFAAPQRPTVCEQRSPRWEPSWSKVLSIADRRRV
jgi:hypothetical protein